MTWSLDRPARLVNQRQQLLPEEVFYEYDEPLIFTASVGLTEMLFTKVRAVDGNTLYLAVPVEPKVLRAVGDGILSLRGAYERSPCLIVEVARGGSVKRYWECPVADIPEALLPTPGVGIDPEAPWVANSFEQIDAFFSVRFSGAGLKKDVMSFATFKALINTTYDSARRIFLPEQLRNTKSATLDFDIREPAFGSLVIAVDRPRLNARNIRRHLRDANADIQGIEEGISARRGDFFEELEEIVRTAEMGSVSVGTAEEHQGLLDQVSELIPDEDSRFDTVEFNALLDGNRRYLAVHEEEGEKIKKALSKLSGRQRQFVGEITIVNPNTYKATIRPDGLRQITCQFDSDEFKNLLTAPKFKSGTRIRVGGKFFRRSQRDYLEVDGTAEILE